MVEKRERQSKKESPQPPYSRGKIAKELLVGFLVTIACNLAGMYFYISAVSNFGVMKSLRISLEQGFFESIVGLGALMDFLAFFVFLRKGQFYRVRGVLLAVLTAAGVVLFFKFGWF